MRQCMCVTGRVCVLHFWAKRHEFVMRSQGQTNQIEVDLRTHTHTHKNTLAHNVTAFTTCSPYSVLLAE